LLIAELENRNSEAHQQIMAENQEKKHFLDEIDNLSKTVDELREEREELMQMFRAQGQELLEKRQENMELKRNMSKLLEKQEIDRRIREEYEKIKSNMIASRQDEMKRFSELFTSILTDKGPVSRQKGLSSTEPGFYHSETKEKKPKDTSQKASERKPGEAQQNTSGKKANEFRPIVKSPSKKKPENKREGFGEGDTSEIQTKAEAKRDENKKEEGGSQIKIKKEKPDPEQMPLTYEHEEKNGEGKSKSRTKGQMARTSKE
jgi:hypothetical protein